MLYLFRSQKKYNNFGEKYEFIWKNTHGTFINQNYLCHEFFHILGFTFHTFFICFTFYEKLIKKISFNIVLLVLCQHHAGII